MLPCTKNVHEEGSYSVVKLIDFLLHECLLNVNFVLILWRYCFVNVHSTVDKIKYFLNWWTEGMLQYAHGTYDTSESLKAADLRFVYVELRFPKC